MAIGEGGKYDQECELLFVTTGAQTACVIVVGGVRGTGFSLSTRDPSHLSLLIGVLRDVANQIEMDARKLPKVEDDD